MPALDVWMNGELVGEWTAHRSGNSVFRYTQDWSESAAARAISLSLPLTADREIRGSVVDHYFDNLLPDNADVRRRIRDRFHLRSADAFDLLAAVGRDCVGAVQLLPPGQQDGTTKRVDATPLTIQDVARTLMHVAAPAPFGQRWDDEEDFRISIAGAQLKTALLKMGGVWYRPGGATPTTHILKLPLGIIGNFRGDFSHSVENEWLCSRLLKELGLPVAEAQIETFDEQKALVVQRFDRRWIGVEPGAVDTDGFSPPTAAWIARLPQEDFCQATGRPPSQRYESDGGPSMEQILDLLMASEHAEADRANFVLAQVAFWLLAATDGHGKNFSIHLQRGGTFRLTPLYDVISAWPVIGRLSNQLLIQDAKLAMAVAGRSRHYRIREIQQRHWRDLAHRIGGPNLWERVLHLVESAPGAFERIAPQLPRQFPEVVITSIGKGVSDQSRRFLSNLDQR